MPAGDRTGPMGRGPMTGRGAGYCGGYDAPGWAGPIAGRGFGFGGGWGGGGRGWRHRNWYYATGVPGWARAPAPGPRWPGRQDRQAQVGYEPAWGYGPYAPAPTREQETEFLRQEAEWLKQKLDAIGQRIEELGGE